MKRWYATGVAAALVSFALSPASALAAEGGIIKVDGSSTVFPITEAVAEEFQIQNRGKVKVTVGIAGTGGGFKKFCRGETDISDASRPILKEEIAACKAAGVEYIELPIAYDALTVVINPKNSWAKTLTIADLKKMWEPAAQGVVSRWNQVHGNWPAQPIALFGPGSDSGTFDYFTEAVNGKAKASRGDYTASEDDNVLVQGVESNVNAIGYFGYAYYVAHQDKLAAAAIDGGKGPVLPSAASVNDGSYQPLSRPIFIYVKKASASRPEVREFVEFYLKEGPALIQEVKYVPLPAKAYDMALANFQKSKLGTVFGGVPEIGIRVEDLLARETK
ncbi:MAG TPA: PstS family phosphate ABC transporter substrate-binding protein [Steroidobacteraceae bacterium]|nr:PstS family phosphate ABC transporter substrate-binding protein [Steroidobacteraceae bacterium]